MLFKMFQIKYKKIIYLVYMWRTEKAEHIWVSSSFACWNCLHGNEVRDLRSDWSFTLTVSGSELPRFSAWLLQVFATCSVCRGTFLLWDFQEQSWAGVQRGGGFIWNDLTPWTAPCGCLRGRTAAKIHDFKVSLNSGKWIYMKVHCCFLFLFCFLLLKV